MDSQLTMYSVVSAHSRRASHSDCGVQEEKSSVNTLRCSTEGECQTSLNFTAMYGPFVHGFFLPPATVDAMPRAQVLLGVFRALNCHMARNEPSILTSSFGEITQPKSENEPHRAHVRRRPARGCSSGPTLFVVGLTGLVMVIRNC